MPRSWSSKLLPQRMNRWASVRRRRKANGESPRSPGWDLARVRKRVLEQV